MEASKHPGVYITWDGKRQRLYTLSLDGKQSKFEEETVKEGDKVYREWDSRRSKLGAAIKNKLKYLPIRPGKTVLYLGAANGYTPSFVSDIVGDKGFVFCIDFAALPLRDLYFLAQSRGNMVAMLYDANKIEEYKEKVGFVDVVYQDIAQRNQTQIFIKNMDRFLKPRGYGLLAVKSRSIDVAKRPREVYNEQKDMIVTAGYEVLEMIDLGPHERDHAMVVCRKKN